MLNPPLSLLSDDLFSYIVGHVAELPSRTPNEHLYSLSITDRAFTWFCQAHIFKVLYLGNRWHDRARRISDDLIKMRNILDDQQSFVNSVRVVNLTMPNLKNAWLFNDLTFISIFELLTKSLMPPHKLHLSGFKCIFFIIEDPILIVGRFMQTFFSQTLTVLHLTYCMDVPLTLLLICPRLREVLLDFVDASENYDHYPDGQCSASRGLPTLDSLDYRCSASLVKRMITPPPRFHTPVVLWSKLRILTLSPHNEEDVACLQPILDIACSTLEELYLTKLPIYLDSIDPLFLAGLVNLKNLSCLRVFALYTIIRCSQKAAILHDMNLVLSTIPTSNEVTSLTFNIGVSNDHPFRCREDDWVGYVCDEVVRISGGKPLKLNLYVSVYWSWSDPPCEEAELDECINKKITSFSEHPNIWTQSCSLD